MLLLRSFIINGKVEGKRMGKNTGCVPVFLLFLSVFLLGMW